MKKYKIDVTTWADDTAAEMRRYYEKHRESWWDRHAPFLVWRSYVPGLADGLMLNLLNIAVEARKRLEKSEIK